MCAAAQSDSSNVTPAVLEKPFPIDLLNRQMIVDQIIRLLDILSASRSSCTFALNGKWGSGKTFVLNMLERQLREYQDGEKYIVFHYNCWQYDYYEEPLVAIIAAMLDSLNEQTNLLSPDTRESFLRKMGVAKPILKTIATSFAKNKLGVDPTEFLHWWARLQMLLNKLKKRWKTSILTINIMHLNKLFRAQKRNWKSWLPRKW